MKSKLVLVIAALFLFALAPFASAVTFTETYKGHQYVGEKDSFNFGFDFWEKNDVFGVGTDSSLSLTADAAGADFPGSQWVAGSLTIDFWSVDKAWDKSKIWLIAWDGSGDPNNTFNLGTITNPYNANNPDNIFTFTHDFTAAQLAAFEYMGWGNVKIKAVRTSGGHYNDFAIKKVEMAIDAVPEPATMALFGIGLIGLAGVSRRKS